MFCKTLKGLQVPGAVRCGLFGEGPPDRALARCLRCHDESGPGTGAVPTVTRREERQALMTIVRTVLKRVDDRIGVVLH